MTNFSSWVSNLVFVAAIYIFIRNIAVYHIRIKFIDDDFAHWRDDEYIDKYEALPSYDQMMFIPKYQHMWTQKAWSDWVDKKLSNPQANAEGRYENCNCK